MGRRCVSRGFRSTTTEPSRAEPIRSGAAREPELSDPMLLLLSELHSSARHFFPTGTPANTPSQYAHAHQASGGPARDDGRADDDHEFENSRSAVNREIGHLAKPRTESRRAPLRCANLAAPQHHTTALARSRKTSRQDRVILRRSRSLARPDQAEGLRSYHAALCKDPLANIPNPTYVCA